MNESIVPQASELIQTPGDAEIRLNMPALFALALEKGVDVGTIERLVALNESEQKKQAAAKFRRSMADLQAVAPVLAKNKPVTDRNGKLMYEYAPLDSIVRQVRDLLTQHGFSYRFDGTVHEGGSGPPTIEQVCIVSHTGGHTEESRFRAVVDTSSSIQNGSQKYASATTFAKRYAFLGAFGFATGEEDDDARGAVDRPPTPQERNQELIRQQRHVDGPVIPEFEPAEPNVDPGLQRTLEEIEIVDAPQGLAQIRHAVRLEPQGPSRDLAEAAIKRMATRMGWRYKGSPEAGEYVEMGGAQS